MAMTAFVFARGGSKGLPDKNVRLLAGKPLIGWAIEQALSVTRIDRVIVSTDSAEIADVARAHGAQVPFSRPADLAGDHVPEMLAWRHALAFLAETEGVMPDPFVSVPATAPLRLPEDIEACIDEYERGEADVALCVTPARSNPWFNMVRRDAAGRFGLVGDGGDVGRVDRRQDAPEVFDIVPVAYVARSSYVMAHDRLFSGRVAATVVPVDRAVDIDTLHDFEIAECSVNRRLSRQGVARRADEVGDPCQATSSPTR